MPFLIVRNDITRMQVDAIVNATNPGMLGGGGVDGAIHAAAGEELDRACMALGGCPVGRARPTPGFRLPCKWVLHTVGPVWQGGGAGERELLESCYRSCLELAESLNCESVAFPLISSGTYGYPKDQAARVALEAIEAWLREHEMTVYLVLYGEESLAASRPIFEKIREYIDNAYVLAHAPKMSRRRENLPAPRVEVWGDREDSTTAFFFREETAPREEPVSAAPTSAAPAGEEKKEETKARWPWQARKKKAEAPAPPPPPAPAPQPPAQPSYAAFEARAEDAAVGASDWRFGKLDESFQQMLLRKIDERGLTDAACYKRANIDRKLFSKIRKDVYYKPSKPTALAFAVALELDLEETEELLEKAGYALSRSSRFGLILRWFIERGIYDVFAINEALFEFDQTLLGNVS